MKLIYVKNIFLNFEFIINLTMKLRYTYYIYAFDEIIVYYIIFMLLITYDVNCVYIFVFIFRVDSLKFS